MLKKNKYPVGGFTLIELLVVVLIIGILAAIALPQYKKTIEKTKVVSFIPLIKGIAQAKSDYYLVTGEWPRKFEQLSLTLPPGWGIRDDDFYGQIAQNNKQEIWLDSSSHSVGGKTSLFDGSTVIYYITPSEGTGIINACMAIPLNSMANTICSNLPHATIYQSYNDTVIYQVY